MTKDEALKLALEALECLKRDFDADQFEWGIADEAITALREALAQPEQEPVAIQHRHEWFRTGEMKIGQMRCISCGTWGQEEMPQRTEQEPVAFAGIEMWVGNTKIKLCLTQMQLHNAKEPWMLIEHMAEMCISKLKEKNT